MVLVQYSDGVSADDLLQSQLNGRLQVHMTVHLRVFDELHEHFGVRVGLEGITLLHQAGFKHGVVLDDTVMDDGEALGLRVVRMGIDGIRLTVRCPTGVRDTDATVRVFLRAEGLQFRHFAFGLIDIELPRFIDERHAGTVITAVLQTMQTLNQNRIRFALADISYNSTHVLFMIYDLKFMICNFAVQNYCFFFNYARE